MNEQIRTNEQAAVMENAAIIAEQPSRIDKARVAFAVAVLGVASVFGISKVVDGGEARADDPVPCDPVIDGECVPDEDGTLPTLVKPDEPEETTTTEPDEPEETTTTEPDEPEETTTTLPERPVRTVVPEEDEPARTE